MNNQHDPIHRAPHCDCKTAWLANRNQEQPPATSINRCGKPCATNGCYNSCAYAPGHGGNHYCQTGC